MARALLAWEFGGALGHVRRLLPIAKELGEAGHEITFAFRDLGALAPYQAASGVFQAPLLRVPASLNTRPLSASDVLLSLGFGDVAGLVGALRGWRNLFDIWTPDVVVADYAPTAMLAARISRVPHVSIGSGFSMPAMAVPMPPLRESMDPQAATLQSIDTRLVSAVGEACDRLQARHAAPANAGEMFSADMRILCTFPELDPFGARDPDLYVGPVGDDGDQYEAHWEPGTQPRIFAYLKPGDPRFGAIVDALRGSGLQTVIAAPGLQPEATRALSGSGLRVFPHALKLAGLLEQADLCVAHGSPGICARALIAGVPMALFPGHLEQYLVSRRVVDAGCASLLATDAAPADFSGWIRNLLADEKMHVTARTQANAYATHDYRGAAREAARRILSLLGR